jgi:hypothetical protein
MSWKKFAFFQAIALLIIIVVTDQHQLAQKSFLGLLVIAMLLICGMLLSVVITVEKALQHKSSVVNTIVSFSPVFIMTLLIYLAAQM